MIKRDDIVKTYNWKDNYYDLYPGYSKPVKEDEDTLFNSEEDVIDDANSLLNMIAAFPDPIPVYRVINVKSLKDIDMNHPGWSWSWSEDSAKAFARSSIPKPWAMLRGFAPKNKVDWLATIRLYHAYSGGHDMDSENEIRIQGKDIQDLKAKMLK